MKSFAADKGYTLIEILIVLFIISIITTVALLSIGRNENKQLESFTNEFIQTLTLAEEQAMLQPTVLGLSLDKQSFHFASLQASIGNNNKTNWEPLNDTLLGKHSIPKNIQISVEVGDKHNSSTDNETKEISNNPQIIISTNGDITPFTIYIGKTGEKPRYAIKGDADGHITNQALS